jgi:hypothetical protein
LLEETQSDPFFGRQHFGAWHLIMVASAGILAALLAAYPVKRLVARDDLLAALKAGRPEVHLMVTRNQASALKS